MPGLLYPLHYHGIESIASFESAERGARATEPGSEGQSDSWKSQKKGVVKMFDTKFRSSSPARIKKYTSNFEELPEVVACDPDTYDDFAWWSANEYKIVSGEYKGGRLSCDTVLNYLSILVNSTCARFSVSNDTAVK